jgi:uncharacterized RDD family membrane protein YckC
MELNEDARKIMENRVFKILKGIDVPDTDRNEIKRELTSNYVDASMVKAKSRGAGFVEKADMLSVLEVSEEPEEIASAYMASYVSSLHRSGVLPRSVAYIIDSFIIAVITWIASIPLILPRYISSPPEPGPPMAPFLPIFLQFFYLIMISNLAIIFLYFVICEGYFGYTPGKWLLGLKVIGADGKKAGYRETMLRSIPKLFILVILADTAMMVLYRRKDRQRLFDRIAGTIVIARNK